MHSTSLSENHPYYNDNAVHGVGNRISAAIHPEERLAGVSSCDNSSFLLFSVGFEQNGSAGPASPSYAGGNGVDNDHASERRPIHEEDTLEFKFHCERTNGRCAGCSPNCAANSRDKHVLADIKCAAYSIGRDASLRPEEALEPRPLSDSLVQLYQGLHCLFGLCSTDRSRAYNPVNDYFIPNKYFIRNKCPWRTFEVFGLLHGIKHFYKLLRLLYTIATGDASADKKLKRFFPGMVSDMGLGKVMQVLKPDKGAALLERKEQSYLCPGNLKLAGLSAHTPSAAAREVNISELKEIFIRIYTKRLSHVHEAVRIEYVLSAMLHATTCKATKLSALVIIAVSLDRVVRSCFPHNIGQLDILAQYILLSLPDISPSPGDGRCDPSYALHSTGGPKSSVTMIKAINSVFSLVTSIVNGINAFNFMPSIDTSLADAINWIKDPDIYQPPIGMLDMFSSDLKLSFEGDTISLTSTGNIAVLAKYLHKNTSLQKFMNLIIGEIVVDETEIKLKMPERFRSYLADALAAMRAIDEIVVNETEIKLKMPGWFRSRLAHASAAMRARGFTAGKLTAAQLHNGPNGKQANPVTWSQSVKLPGLQLFDVLDNKFIPWESHLPYITVSYSRSEIGYVRTQVEGLMEKCKEFDIRYLWVDFLCWKPNQDSIAYFDMVKVYCHANATVIIDPYVYKRHVNNSAWSSRIWTRAEVAVSSIVMSYSCNQLTTVSNKRHKFRTLGEALSWFHDSVSYSKEDSTIALGGLRVAARNGNVDKSMYACLSRIKTEGLFQYVPSADESLCWLPRVGGSKPSLVQRELAKTKVLKKGGLSIEATELVPNLHAFEKPHSPFASKKDMQIDIKNVIFLQVAAVESGAVCWMVKRQQDIFHVLGSITLGKDTYRELGIKKVVVNGLVG
ncbi:hypothetical protein INT44_008031 [Umbelopsis vinacea]|uniref:Heterokaryon incompatibility domain-containing protein n=1 Tax=Umbelopsis vinacea TaxID=44442 RepID=A0A8H7PPF4_9FUNG|nr:hypothetical protein INT44_008031 [Umbelopsis vinacea]